MLGLKSFASAASAQAGIELVNMIRKGCCQFNCRSVAHARIWTYDIEEDIIYQLQASSVSSSDHRRCGLALRSLQSELAWS